MEKYLTERKLYWPVSSELMASYKDGSHSEEWANGTLLWFKKNGQRHRDDDKPAVIESTGRLAWYKNGILHRDDDRPAVIDATGALSWWKNDKLHRDSDKPARIYADGSLAWYKNAKWHRTTGPAVINQNNKKEYWINDVDITKKVNAWLETRKYKDPFTPEQQVEFTLTFS
jgi:hypothetical protein